MDHAEISCVTAITQPLMTLCLTAQLRVTRLHQGSSWWIGDKVSQRMLS